VLQEAGLDAVADDPFAAGLSGAAGGQHLSAAWRHALAGAIVDAHVPELRERPGERKPGLADD
jgi:hypothetical protein